MPERVVVRREIEVVSLERTDADGEVVETATARRSRVSARVTTTPTPPIASPVIDDEAPPEPAGEETVIEASVAPASTPPTSGESDLDDMMTDAFGDAPSYLGGEARSERTEPLRSDAPAPAVEVAMEGMSIPPPPPGRSTPRAEKRSEPPDARSNYAVEETIDRLLADSRTLGEDPAARKRVADAFAEIAGKLGGEMPEPPAQGLLGDLFRSEHYAREWGPHALRDRGSEVDAFGLDRAYEARMRPLLETLQKRWFRTIVRDVGHVPRDGRAMLVANHGGALPWDGLMLRLAVASEHPARREVRWLVEDSVFHAPFLGATANRLGAVRACPENAERLLADDEVVAVFPEGDKGAGKPFAQRYELQRFGRGGYVRLALRTRTPIVPVAIVGAEETNPVLFSTRRLAKLVGLPSLPVTATFPWLGPIGLMPLPSRWVMLFGEPIDLSAYAPATAEDPIAVQRISDEVRGAVQTLLSRALALRPSTF
jgi:1-acyl-sn-glycerol-3-phosphate acyltransferase